MVGNCKENKTLPQGVVLTADSNAKYIIGTSIGKRTYAASIEGESDYVYAIKCEPYQNGRLLTEIGFYMNNGKEEHLSEYKNKKNLKALGMPHMISKGLFSLDGIKHLFMVMPRYGQSVEHYLLTNGRLPTGTVYRLAIQMLDVYEYIHQRGYVHADLKAANILVGLGENGASQAYLIDFGLACMPGQFNQADDYKRYHYGTIKYTSRHGHYGSPSAMGDLEILGYNLVEWLGAKLPWVGDEAPLQVQATKRRYFMPMIREQLGDLFPQGIPKSLERYLHNFTSDRPIDYQRGSIDYNELRKIFQDGLKALKVSDIGDLEFNIETPASSNAVQEKYLTLKVDDGDLFGYDYDPWDDPYCTYSDDENEDIVFVWNSKKKHVQPVLMKSAATQTEEAKLHPIVEQEKSQNSSAVVPVKKLKLKDSHA